MTSVLEKRSVIDRGLRSAEVESDKGRRARGQQETHDVQTKKRTILVSTRFAWPWKKTALRLEVSFASAPRVSEPD